MKNKSDLRKAVEDNLDEIVKEINLSLSGQNIAKHEQTLNRLGRGGKLPHWYHHLSQDHVLPNLDGKTVGSIIEMLLVAVLEDIAFKGMDIQPLKINPARGVDLPDLDLGIKSPSENFCTSEPFYSAYERLIGGEYDSLVLLTDYQTAKKNPPLRLQIIKWKYLSNTQIADMTLCRIARKHRDRLLNENEAWAQKLFRFLAYINQSDWSARHILSLVNVMDNQEQVRELIEKIKVDFSAKNKILTAKDLPPMPDSYLEKIVKVAEISPLSLGVLDCADNWVVESQKELARFPNENELNRLKDGPLDGKIGMSFALQWRYNFGKVFGVQQEEVPIDIGGET